MYLCLAFKMTLASVMVNLKLKVNSKSFINNILIISPQPLVAIGTKRTNTLYINNLESHFFHQIDSPLRVLQDNWPCKLKQALLLAIISYHKLSLLLHASRTTNSFVVCVVFENRSSPLLIPQAPAGLMATQGAEHCIMRE